MSVYALNLSHLAPDDDHVAYSRRSAEAVGRYGGEVLAGGALDLGTARLVRDVEPREVMLLVEWPDRAAFEGFLDDASTQQDLWWAYDRLDDLQPLLSATG